MPQVPHDASGDEPRPCSYCHGTGVEPDEPDADDSPGEPPPAESPAKRYPALTVVLRRGRGR